MPDDLWSDPTAPSFDPPTQSGTPAAPSAAPVPAPPISAMPPAPPIPRPPQELRVQPAPVPFPAVPAPAPPPAKPPTAPQPGDPMPAYGPSADRPPADARFQLGPRRDPHLPAGAWLLCFASIVAMIPSFFLVGIPSLIFGARAALSSGPPAERDRLVRRGWAALIINTALIVIAGAAVVVVIFSRALR